MSSYQKGNVGRKQFIVVGEINQAKYLFSLIICLAQMHINPPPTQVLLWGALRPPSV